MQRSVTLSSRCAAQFGGALYGSANATIHVGGAAVLHNNTASEVRRVVHLSGTFERTLEQN